MAEDLVGAAALLEPTTGADVAGRQVVQVAGADRVSFLHRLVTGDVAGTAVGRGSRSLLLTTKGHIVLDMHVFVRAEDVRLVVARGQAQAGAAALGRYAVMDDVAVAPLDWESRTVVGARAFAELTGAGVAVPSGFESTPAWSHVEAAGPGGPVWLVHARELGRTAAWMFGPAEALSAIVDRLAGVPRLDAPAAEALRILAGEPKVGAEITEEYFPMEIGLDAAIDYTKGCYLGQEPIVRIRDRGHVNWRLAGLRLRDDVQIAPGDRLESEAKPKAGRVTSVGRLPGSPPVALAMVHVSVPAGAEVRVLHGEQAHAAEVLGLSA